MLFSGWNWFYHILNSTLKMSFSEPAEVKISSNANSVIDIDFHLQLALTCLTVHEMLSKTKRMMHFSSWIWFYKIMSLKLKISCLDTTEVKISSNSNSVIDIEFHLQLALTCLTVHEMLSKTKRLMHF